MSSLNIVQVYRALADRRKRRRDTYTAILRSCERHIQAVAARDGLRCTFLVPEFRVGLPTFDVNECTRFVRTELEKAGFVVRYFFPNILHISWDVADLERQAADKQPQGGAALPPCTSDERFASQAAALPPPPQPRAHRRPNGRFFLELE